MLSCSADTKEKIKWDGECIHLEDFHPIEIAADAPFDTFDSISAYLKDPYFLTYINDSTIAYSEFRDNYLLRIANLNQETIQFMIPASGETGEVSSVNQIIPMGEEVWLIDTKDSKAEVLQRQDNGSYLPSRL